MMIPDLNYEQWLKATDMSSISEFLTEVCHKDFHKIFMNGKHPSFSRITFNHRDSSCCQLRLSRCRTTKRQMSFFSTK